MKESDLYDPLKQYFEGQGCRIAAEVRHTDLVVRQNGMIFGVEMKLRFSLDLVYQLLKRRGIFDGMYAAVYAPGGRVPKLREITMLLSALGFGLILVSVLKTKTKIEIVLQCNREGAAAASRHRERTRVLNEIDGRYAELSPAGIPGSETRMTAYRQQSLMVLEILSRSPDPLRPKDVIDSGGPKKAQIILSGNLYGWFVRIARGRYSASSAGLSALREYSPLIGNLRNRRRNDTP